MSSSGFRRVLGPGRDQFAFGTRWVRRGFHCRLGQRRTIPTADIYHLGCTHGWTFGIAPAAATPLEYDVGECLPIFLHVFINVQSRQVRAELAPWPCPVVSNDISGEFGRSRSYRTRKPPSCPRASTARSWPVAFGVCRSPISSIANAVVAARATTVTFTSIERPGATAVVVQPIRGTEQDAADEQPFQTTRARMCRTPSIPYHKRDRFSEGQSTSGVF